MIIKFLLASWVFLFAFTGIILVMTMNDTANLITKKTKNVKQNTFNNNVINSTVRIKPVQHKTRCGFTVKEIS